jgi:hypothetical protein
MFLDLHHRRDVALNVENLVLNRWVEEASTSHCGWLSEVAMLCFVCVPGETKRKFESVYTGGTLTTVGGGEIVQYWHCCGVTDPFDGGCEAAPHMSYDD